MAAILEAILNLCPKIENKKWHHHFLDKVAQDEQKNHRCHILTCKKYESKKMALSSYTKGYLFRARARARLTRLARAQLARSSSLTN